MLTLTPDLKSAAASLTADDWMLLAQVGRSSTLGEVFARSTLDEAHTVALLERLLTLGVLTRSAAGDAPPEAYAAAPSRAPAAAAPSRGAGLGDILELVSSDVTREVSVAQRSRAESSVAAALEAASVSPAPAPQRRRLPDGLSPLSGSGAFDAFGAGTPVLTIDPVTGHDTLPFGADPGALATAGASGDTLHFGPSPVPAIGALTGRAAASMFPGEGALPGDTLHFGPSPVPAIGALTGPPAGSGAHGAGLPGDTLHFGSSPVPSIGVLTGELDGHVPASAFPGEGALPGDTLHFGPSPLPPFETPVPERKRVSGPAGPFTPEGAFGGGTLPFGPSPIPPDGALRAEGQTLAFGAAPTPVDAALSGGTLHFGLSPVPTIEALGQDAVDAGEGRGREALRFGATPHALRSTMPPEGEAALPPDGMGPTSQRGEAPDRQLSAAELEEALADTLVGAPRRPDLERFLGARTDLSTSAPPTTEAGLGGVTPTATSALLLETEAFDGIGTGPVRGAPPPLSWSETPVGEAGSADASVVLASEAMTERAELVAELTEAATHGTATEPPDAESACAGHTEGLPFTPAPSVHNPGRAKAREAERPAREAKLPPNVFEEVLRLEDLASRGDLFAVFSLPRGASPAEVKKVFHSLSRRLHPDHYFHLGAGAQKARLETVFRRVTEAHAILVDPDRRRAWAEANPSMSRPRSQSARAVPRAPDAEQRDEERRERLARHPYLLKQTQPRLHLAQGRALLARGAFGEALELLERARAADPQNPEIPRLLASAREGQKVRRASEEEAQGRKAERAGRLDEAVDCYRRAATLDPSNGAVALQAARVLEREGGDLREARLFAQRAVELRPADADAQWLLAQILLRSGARKLARGPLEEVLRLQPKHPSARSQLRQLRLGL